MSVFGASRGVKTWSNTPRTDVVEKPTELNSQSAQEMQKLGGENVGEILNRVADPNWIDPRKKMRTVGSDKMDKDAFMKLMLAQMRNQDPTNPLKSHEMAAQLAQFTSVEQLMNINTGIESLKAGAKPSESYQSLNFIGKAVSGDSSRVIRVGSEKQHDFTYQLPEDSTGVLIKVQNAEGEVIRKFEIPKQNKGTNTWVWNGEDERGTAVPPGTYNFSVEALQGTRKLAVDTKFNGVISGVQYTPEGPVLLIGNKTVRLKDVDRIQDPSVQQNDQKAAVSAPSPGKQDGLKNIMNDVAISGQLKNQLTKELK